LSLIENKREGKILAPEQIQEFIREFTTGKISDYQMAAMLMAIYFRGLDTAETTALTLAMRDSGDVLKFPRDKRPLVDKHSTGGIGDKVSLPLAPLLACLGFRVPMISGRGLGITGGTLDKLDSIPGFKTLLPAKQIVAQVQKVGCVICGQTDKMVPADKKIYALRDASGTVPSIPLITASILSKKLAESLDALILDVKFGSAAFMQTKADARKLAKAMVTLGNECGVNTRAILTDMNTPLGHAAGNWLEVKESVACLEPRSSRREEAHTNSTKSGKSLLTSAATADDLRSLVLDSAAHLLVQTRKSKSLAAARKLAEACLNSGKPRQKWDEMIVAQGADLKAFNRKLTLDSPAKVVVEFKSEKAGYVSKCDARIIGEVIRDIGGGRLTKESAINYDVGLDKISKPGERVEKSTALCRVHAADPAQAKTAILRLKTAFEISVKRPAKIPLVVEIISR
ncbi:MAG TPA: thymidine phosphorylase, partial [Candidatus Limnocylindrales bacterium]|nr:thymidine phosphorylase [Candidatus Limnocylindrales bacterium]